MKEKWKNKPEKKDRWSDRMLSLGTEMLKMKKN